MRRVQIDFHGDGDCTEQVELFCRAIRERFAALGAAPTDYTVRHYEVTGHWQLLAPDPVQADSRIIPFRRRANSAGV
jgi:hypothetical protein